MNIREKYLEFFNRVSKTRECRINASSRLAYWDTHYQIVQLIYAVFTTGVSIWIFYLEKMSRITSASDASTIILICSFSITGTSFYVSSKNYKERSILLKNNYVSLNKLLYDIESVLCMNYDDQILINHYKEHFEKYMTLLQSVENHSTLDYLETRQQNNSLNKFQYLTYYWNKTKIYILSWFISLCPLILTLYLIKLTL